MPIDADEVRRIARLARLELDESSVELLRHQLRRILDHAALLQELDAEVEPATPGPVERRVGLREDRARASAGVERCLRGAPEADDGFFRVPRVLDR